MKAGAHTHRETLAFVLAIVGAMAWSMFPLGGLMLGDGNDDHTDAMLSIAIAGALLGAWSATSTWRHISVVIAPIAGGLCMAGVVGASDLMFGPGIGDDSYYAGARPQIDIGAFDIAMIAAVAAAAYGGAALGRRAKIPHVAVTASWITFGVVGIAATVMVVLHEMHIAPAHDTLLSVVFLVPFPGACVATIFCHVRPGAFAGRLFLLIGSAFVLLALTTLGPQGEPVGILFSSALFYGGLLAFYGAVAAWIGHAIRNRMRQEPALPPAHVVER